MNSHAVITTRFSTTAIILVLSLGYAIIGRLALLLAIPPGYATAIFPPAGIALAALLLWGNRVWAGIFLGSLTLNLWIGLEQAPLSLPSFAVSVCAATGAVMQALVGSWLIRRFVGEVYPLAKEQAIFLTLVIGGPIACLINASFGTTGLWLSGIIPTAHFAFSWFIWWVGDAIGVLITLPIIFIFFSQPRQLWWKRRYSLGVPMVIMVTVILFLFILLSRIEQAQARLEFREVAQAASEKLSVQFSRYLEVVESIERFFVSSVEVTQDEFRSFVANSLVTKAGFQGLGWNPIVTLENRDQFVADVRASGLADFNIMQRDSGGNLVVADAREAYVVVRYLEPFLGNQKAFGFDVASNPKRKVALEKARDTGKPVATEKIILVQENEEQAGFLLFYPVYKGIQLSVEDRRKNIVGFAVGVFKVSNIVEQVISSELRENFILRIYDRHTKPAQQFYGPPDAEQDSPLKWENNIKIGGREWYLKFEPSAKYLTTHQTWRSWSILAVGLFISSVFGGFLLAMTGRSYQTEKIVERRTAELRGILSTVLETIITTDEEGNIESINAAGEVLFGYRFEHVIGKSIILIIPDFFSQDSENIHASPLGRITESRRDLTAISYSQKEIPIELAVSRLVLEDKTLYTLVIHDLTERTKINRMKDEFISTVSHELRTPLTSIKGTLGLVTGGILGEVSEKIENVLKIAYQNSERLESLINELLDINKIHSTDLSLSLELIDLNDLVNKSISANQGFADKYEVLFQWQYLPDNRIIVKGDEMRLNQVLSNLFSNAIKYSPQKASVIVALEKINDKVRVSITDQGPGIPLEFQSRVFDKFTQADSSDTRRVGGTGLGLAITKTIVEKHNGKIGFVSKPGKGATFYFELNICKDFD
ncbi:CHASE domain-containing protein [Aliikangiella maris]|uniref:histidine kinase n=2 Tax=Aliikangiella maris TaxID=3162458 RepID=A0ABV2BTM3_9GAMM